MPLPNTSVESNQNNSTLQLRLCLPGFHPPLSFLPSSPISRVFKVVWAAYKAPRRSASPHDESSLDALLGDGANASLYLPAEANGGSLYQNGDGGINGGTHGAGMGRPTKSLQWLDQATEARVQGERGCGGLWWGWVWWGGGSAACGMVEGWDGVRWLGYVCM
jgi:hypothetical protein